MLQLLALFALFVATAAQGAVCQDGSYVLRNATTIGPGIITVLCAGVCQLTAGPTSDLIQTASCVPTLADCEAKQLLSFEFGGSDFAAVKCCSTADCNDPTVPVYSYPLGCHQLPTFTACSTNLNCGWCQTTGACLVGNALGTQESCTDFVYPWNTVTSGVDAVGNHILNGYLRPGVPSVVTMDPPTVNYTGVDLLILADASTEMRQAIIAVGNSLAQIAADVLATTGTPLRVGVATFLGLPISNQGAYNSNYLFRLESQLTTDLNVITDVIAGLEYGTDNNIDTHSSLSALLYSANGGEVNWGRDHFRFALVVTDANSSVAGDGAPFGIFTPNNYDGVLDAAPGQPAGTGEDYPAPINDFIVPLVQAGIYPLFGAIDCTDPSCPRYSNGVNNFFDQIVFDLEFGDVVNLDSIFNGTNSTNAIWLAMEPVLVYQDPSSPSFEVFNADKYGRIVDNPSPYQITVYVPATSTSLQNSVIAIHEFPYPRSSVLSTVVYPPAIGCNGVPGGPVLDLCGVCGGSNSCIGCNGENDTLTADQCGVCGGDGTSCVGCDGRPFSGLVYDICGVCGGDGTSCLGCDGYPNSGLTVSSCGTCGQTPAECDPNDVHPIGIAGIVLIISSFFMLFFFLIAVAMGKSSIEHQRSKLKKDPLFIEAQQRYKPKK